MLEQRIAGNRHEDGVARRRAQQLEQERVGFAGARGEHDAVGRGPDTTAGVVADHRLPRGEQSERFRGVVGNARAGQRCEQSLRVDDARARRIADRQIDELATGRTRRTERARERIGSSWRGTRGENIAALSLLPHRGSRIADPYPLVRSLSAVSESRSVVSAKPESRILNRGPGTANPRTRD